MDVNRALADNLAKLKADRGDSQKDIAKRGGISQRAVSYVLSYGKTHETSPTTQTIAGLAKAYGVPSWMLLIPDLPLEILKGSALPSLVACFVAAGDEGRVNIARVAEVYSTLPATARTGTGG